MIKVITYGTYDLLHYGHIRLLQRAKALGDYLIVGVTADDFDKARGKINVQQSLMERIEGVRATGIADEIIIEEYEGQKIDDILRLDVDVFTVGSDWKGKFDYLKDYCNVVYLERTEGVSSTELRSKISKIRISTQGENGLCNKFKNEMKFINGLEFTKFNKDYDDFDAVYIATLPEHHYRDVKRALLNGKHVICESPIAIRKDDCEELFKLADERNLILFDGIKTAYSTAYDRMLKLAKSGSIGEIVSIDTICTSNIINEDSDLETQQNSICARGPTGLLPIFQLLGCQPNNVNISTKLLNKELNYDGFTRISFIYKNAVASCKIAKAAKSEGELIITGTKGYIYVPAPWWKTDYFEIRFENQNNNKKYFYQLDGEGIRNEIINFIKSIKISKKSYNLNTEISVAIVSIIEKFYSRDYILLGDKYE